jgi:hypothetical protein
MKAKWAKLRAKGDHRAGKQAEKNNILALCLTYPDDWQKRHCAESRPYFVN